MTAANKTEAAGTISSVTVALSKPSLVSALSLSADVQTVQPSNGISESNVFTFLSALTLAMILAASIAGCTASSSSARGAPSATISVTAAAASGAGGATSGLPLEVAQVVRR